MANVNFQLGAEVELFNTKLVSMIDSSGTMIVRQPKTGAAAPGISINAFVEEIAGVFKMFGVDAPKIEIPELVQEATKGIDITLKEVFLLIKAKTSVDFAIWVSMDVDTKKAPFNKFPINLKSGYLKIWNTTNPVIKDELDIGIIEKLLAPEAGTDEEAPAPGQK